MLSICVEVLRLTKLVVDSHVQWPVGQCGCLPGEARNPQSLPHVGKLGEAGLIMELALA